MPPPPTQARERFGAHLPALQAYAEMLAGAGIERGLLGPREAPRLWDRHLLNCAALADLVPAGANVCDVGSGAGLPGVVLAISRPDLTMTLVEPLLRRSVFLTEVRDELGLDHVQVWRGRAEDYPHRDAFTVVTARAVAPLGRLAGWCAPLLALGGELLAMKGASAPDELARDEAELRSHGLVGGRAISVGGGDEQTWVVRATRKSPHGRGKGAA